MRWLAIPLSLGLMSCALGLESMSDTATLAGDELGAFGQDADGNSCFDDDGDGFNTCDGDCDDGDPLTFPGAAFLDSETGCMTDGDGDGWGDLAPLSEVDAGTDCDDGDPLVTPEDADGDGYSSCDDDCDDGDPSLNPSEEDVPWDGLDQDCDGSDAGKTIIATGAGNQIIDDYQTTTDLASVSGCTELYELTVDLNITHTYQGDLEVSLRSPGGNRVVLHDNTGNGTDNIRGTYSTTGGSLSSAEPLNRLLGTDVNGEWMLSIYDSVGGDQGTLNAWELQLDCP